MTTQNSDNSGSHPNQWQYHLIAGRWAQHAEDYDQAERMHKHCLNFAHGDSNTAKMRRAAALVGLGVTYILKGEYTVAERVLLSALNLRRQLLGSRSPLTAEVIRLLGNACQGARRFDEADRHYRSAMEMLRHLPFSHPEVIVLVDNLSDLSRLRTDSPE